ncbi:MAG: serine dehydratase [Phycisphaeraceae bacterium]|nr:serine dehydratase [Phycisphaeraceae bacterium]
MTAIGRATIEQAAARIEPFAHRTPALTCRTLDDRFGAVLQFKCENLQKVGAFKFRGATNAVRSLSDGEAARGVITHSSGNHAQALALAARDRGIAATIVMPSSAPAVKRAAVEGYGATVIECAPTLEARESTTAAQIEESGAVLVHPYNDPRIIAGQATAAKELFEQAGALDFVLAPVGGGGLLAGTACAASAWCPAARVVGAEPAGADDAQRSFRAGRIIPSTDPQTIADGLLTSLGDQTFPLIMRHVHDIVTVSEAAIVEAMRLVWQRMKIIVEPSAAVPVAALIEQRLDVRGARVGIILSGGNVDLDRLPW